MKIFGLEISRKQEPLPQSVVAPLNDDGATTIATGATGYYAQAIELETIIKNENDIIRRYRETAQYPDCDSAIDDITNEAIVMEEDTQPVELKLDQLKVPDTIKTKIKAEFEEVLKLLKFGDKGHDIFRNWYIDGRCYYHILADEKNPKNGIIELRPIDPRKIRKIKNVNKKKTPKGVDIVTGIDEFYLYNDKGIVEQSAQGVRLPTDSVIYVPSGLIDQNSGMVISYLHKSIKTVNQLRMLEDAMVIYRITRAPDRRIFYIDVGNLPKLKAEQYVTDIMNKFRNKVTYDATTGEVKSDKKHMSMMEDFFMPRREGGKGSEITTLPGLQNTAAMDDVTYFQNKLYQALNVPASRLKGDTGFNLGRSSEITRDEIKFAKFVDRIRNKFARLFLDALRVQLILKGVINPDDWKEIEQFIKFDFIRDNHFAEIKENEIQQGRVNLLATIDPYVGKYYSINWVKKNILKLDDDEIKEMDKEIEDDREAILNHQQVMQGIDPDAPPEK